jgi:putative hydrolase of the HAD superfamily
VANVLPGLPDGERAFRELWVHFSRPEAWRCFPDVAPALKGLREAGIAVGIASNFDARLRGVVAGLDELSGAVGPLVISSEVGYRKPHPSFFSAVCEAMGRPAGRLLFVGDEVANDVRGAQRAGLRAIWLDRRGRGADPSLPQAEDLMRIVSSRNA